MKQTKENMDELEKAIDIVRNIRDKNEFDNEFFNAVGIVTAWAKYSKEFVEVV